MSESSDHPVRPALADLEAAALARRKLLKLSIYVAPAIIGTFTLRASAQVSCGPPGNCGPKCQEKPCNPCKA